MTKGFVLHSAVCIPFSGAGGWLFIQLIHGEHERIDSVFVATYWFGFLVFVLSSWIFYWILQRRLAKPWIPAQLAALLIAGLVTTSIVWASHLYEPQQSAGQKTLLKPESDFVQPGDDGAG